MNRILLAYSGSLATSAAIPWLAAKYRAEVVTLTLDVGQGLELSHIRERALSAGATRAHVIDAREELVRGHILPALRSGRFSPERGFPGAALSHPLVAARLVEIAQMEGAAAVAHGCACDAEDRADLEGSIRALSSDLRIIAPACEWNMSPEDLAGYARARGIQVTAGRHDHIEANVWGRWIAGQASPADFKLTRPADDAPDQPAFVQIDFENGIPVRTNGVDMPVIELIESLETLAGAHGVGRIIVSGGVAEAPAAVVLDAAHAAVARHSSAGANGGVRMKLFKGACEVEAVL